MSKLKPITIKSSLANYQVIFCDEDDFTKFSYESDFFIIDDFFKDTFNNISEEKVFWINASEEAKSYDKFVEIFLSFKQENLNRESSITAIGGGVIQDIATFCASIYMRGIKWNYIPTTFLGMTDSCLGGKSSINVGQYKNLIGNFHPPIKILIYPSFIRSLPLIELLAGLSETAKICYCKSNKDFQIYLNLYSELFDGNLGNHQINSILSHTLLIKKWFIEKDEFDKAERKLLNYGHTWGHALESATNFLIPHGIAISMGMMASVEFTNMNFESDPLWLHCKTIVLKALDITKISNFQKDKFENAFNSDKKHTKDNYALIIPSKNSASKLGVEEIKITKNSKNLSKIVSAMIRTISILNIDLNKRNS